jgi:DHA1 family bicyclomycin/chloramphenicol resistance-like MFS transporter
VTDETVTRAEPRRHLGGTRGQLVLLGALTGLTPLAVDMYLPALPVLTRDLHSTSSATQLTLAALLVGLAGGQLIAGPVSDRVGRRPPVLIGLAGFVLASVGCAFAPSVPLLVALRLLQGFAGAAAVVVARAVVRDLYEGAAAARAFASLMLVMGAAPIFAPVLGAQVLRVTSWRGVFVVLAFAGAALLLATARKLPETLPPDCRSAGGLGPTLRVFAMLLRDRRFLLPTLAGGAGFAAMFAYISGSSNVLQEVHGLSAQQFSAVFGLNATVLILLSQVSARVVGRTGPRRLLLIGTATQVVGGVLLVVAALAEFGLPVVLLGLVLVVGAGGFNYPNATALALEHHGRTAGAASALLGVLQYVLGAVAAPLTGLGGSRTGTPMAVTMLGCAVVAFGCALASVRVATRAGAGLEPAPADRRRAPSEVDSGPG